MTTTVKQVRPFARNHLLRDAINQAIYEAMQEDSSIYLMGEGAWVKKHYDYPQMLRDFPDRLLTMPIAEDGGINFACGAALMGVKPIYDVISSDFLFRAMDSIANTAAKLNFARHGQEPATIVIQAECLLNGPTTGQRLESAFVHVPGLNVVMPSTPHDAYGLMHTVLREPGVTLFLEDRMIQDDGPWQGDDLEFSGPLPIGVCQPRKMGKRGNVTILTYGVMRQVVERALASFKSDRWSFADEADDMQCDVIDLCSLYPIHWQYIVKMLERTGKVLIVEPDVVYGGLGAEIAAVLHERRPHIKVKRLGAPRETIPANPANHSRFLPSEDDILTAIKAMNDGSAFGY